MSTPTPAAPNPRPGIRVVWSSRPDEKVDLQVGPEILDVLLALDVHAQ